MCQQRQLQQTHQRDLPIGINTEKYYYYTFGNILPWYYLKHWRGKWDCKDQRFDKRENFNFKIVNFPYLDSNIPRNPAYGVYISQLVRYARICSRKDDFIYRHRRLSLKLQQQGYKYQQLMKSFHKFYRSHSDELKKFGTTLMELRSSISKEVLVEYILLNYIWTYFWCVRGCVFIFFYCFMCYLLRARFPIFCSRACIIVMYIQLTLNAYFILTVIILFSLPILTFVQ